MMVWSHSMVFAATPEDAVDAGVDVLSHVCDIGYQAFRERPASYTDRNRFPVPAEMFARGDNPDIARLYKKMAKKGSILDATLYIYRSRPRPEGAAANPQDQPRCTFDVAKALTLQAYRAGVAIATGTDGFSQWEDPYLSVHTEMELLQSIGLSPFDVMEAATINGARVIGKENEMGSLDTGKLANMVFVSKDPSKDLANLKNVVLVVKRGEQYPRSDYSPLTEEDARQRPMDSVKLLPPPK
jgi:hypothetical protein